MFHSPQQVRFCTSRDGVRIAYATSGQGPPLVRAAGLITHLEYDWDSPIWHPWLSALSRRNTLVRYDARGSGLSDRERVAFTFDRYLEDLEAVIAAADLGRVALFGIGGGGALAVAFAALHPQKVSHLVLYGAFARGALARATSRGESMRSKRHSDWRSSASPKTIRVRVISSRRSSCRTLLRNSFKHLEISFALPQAPEPCRDFCGRSMPRISANSPNE